jgi:valyl-tRNA synthetase
MIASPAGNDLLFDEAALDQGRNFNNKLWNALKLVKGWEGNLSTAITAESHGHFAIEWFEYRLNNTRENIEKLFNDFKLSEALKTLYSLIWDDFCSWYLEWVKPGFGQSIDREIHRTTIRFFEELIQLLHPFMPFITEEIYHLLGDRTDDLCVKQFEKIRKSSSGDIAISNTEISRELIQKIREFRNKKGLKRDKAISIYPEDLGRFPSETFDPMLKIVNATMSKVGISTNEDNGPVEKTLKVETILIGTFKFYIDLGNLGVDFNAAVINSELTKELSRLQGLLDTINKKLENERFVQNAKPEVIDNEKKKKEDTELKIKAIEESLSTIK